MPSPPPDPTDRDEPGERDRHVVVVGGGIAGLAAAWFLRRDAASAGTGVRVSVLEGSPVLGGKLRVSEVAGVAVDEGAESLLLRRPEGVAMIAAAGLGGDQVEAVTSSAAIWSRGHLHPMPAGTVMGVPTDLRRLAESGLLNPLELARVPLDTWLPRTPVGDDVSVGHYVASRVGRPVVTRLVEPLLGGVYAGHADLLSLAATLPQLLAHVRRDKSLLGAAAAARRAAPPTEGPVFGSLLGGLGRLPDALARAGAAQVRTGETVRALRRTPGGWALTVGSTRAPRLVEADAVVLAVPAPAASRLLRPLLNMAATDLAAIPYASTVIVTLAFAAPLASALPSGSGFLVPPADRRPVKAVTYSTQKWGWYAEAAPGVVVVRLSLGRQGEEATLQRDDDELVEQARTDLADAVGLRDTPLDARVTRWGGGLPQYTVGHLARVERIRAAVAAVGGLALCGAAYDGIGVPACVASAERAAAEILGDWRHG